MISRIDNDLPQLGQKSSRTSIGTLILRALVSALFIGVIVWQIDFVQMGKALHSVEASFFLFSFFFFMLSEIPIALRLKALLRPTVLHPGFGRLLQIDVISRFYAVFLPSGVGTNLFRWYKITENRSGRGQFFVVLAVEKVLFLTVTLLASGLPLLLVRDDRVHAFKTGFLPIFWLFAGSVSLFFLYLLVPAIQSASDRIAWPFRRSLKGRAADVWDRLAGAARIYRGQWRTMLLGFLFSICAQVCLLLLFFCLFVALHVELPVTNVLWISSLVFLIQTLPISVAGVGVRESGFAYLVSLYNIPAEKGVLIGILFGVLFLMRSMVGVALYWAEKRLQTS